MSSKKYKKYQQAISAPGWKPVEGAKLSDGLRGLIAKLFGVTHSNQPTLEEIIDYHLTAREREIAYLAALGFADKEIADALGMTFQTVRAHLRNAMNKMQLDDVRELQQYFPLRRP